MDSRILNALQNTMTSMIPIPVKNAIYLENSIANSIPVTAPKKLPSTRLRALTKESWMERSMELIAPIAIKAGYGSLTALPSATDSATAIPVLIVRIPK